MAPGYGHLNDDSQVSISHLPTLTDANNQGTENSSNKRHLSKSNLLQHDQGNDNDGSNNNLDGTNNNWGHGANDRNGSNNDMV